MNTMIESTYYDMKTEKTFSILRELVDGYETTLGRMTARHFQRYAIAIVNK